MVAGGQGEALKTMEKSIPMGRVGRPEETAVDVAGPGARPVWLAAANHAASRESEIAVIAVGFISVLSDSAPDLGLPFAGTRSWVSDSTFAPPLRGTGHPAQAPRRSRR